MKYLQTDDKQEQRGRAEDGPVGLKHKWSDWPHVTPGVELINGSKKKTAHKKAVTKTATTKTSTPSKTSTSTQGAGKK